MTQTVRLMLSIAVGSWLLSACLSAPSLVTRPEPVAAQSIAQPAPAVTRTPSGIFISTRVPPLATSTPKGKTITPGLGVIVQGRVFDAGSGQQLNNATVEWQFVALEQQPHNGQLQVPADGIYRLSLPVRPADEVIFTAQAPGYESSMARLHGSQLSPYGSRLNFGLVAEQGPAPTLPGALGTIQLRGIVYNVAHGLKDPLAQAHLTIVNRSVVQPVTPLEVTSGPTGTFLIALSLHSTDQLEFTIAASGYQTGTLTRSAKDLAKNPQLLIGLRPIPK